MSGVETSETTVLSTSEGPRSRRGRDRSFKCSISGCEKSFTRAEHLHRHALNHTNVDWPCDLCTVNFKRKDLLERHRKRHRERDEETGGMPGSGILNTRKRQSKNQTSADMSQKVPKISKTTELAASTMRDGSRLPSPPSSSTTSYRNHTDAPSVGQNIEGSYEGLGVDITSWNDDGAMLDLDILPPGMDFCAPTGFGQQMETSTSFAPFDEVFQPDTASSFNMPFTTISNYNWLFDVDLSMTDNIEGEFPLIQPMDSAQAEPVSTDFLGTLPTGILGVNDHVAQTIPSFCPVSVNTAYESRLTADKHTSTLSDTDPLIPSLSNQTPPTQREIPQDVNSVSRYPTAQYQTPSASMSTASPDLAHHTVNSSPQSPALDEVSREELLDLVDRCAAKNPDGSRIGKSHPLLSLSSLQTFFDLYFSHFNIAYPLLHCQTFEPADTDPLLLMAIIHIGASYSSDKASHQLAVCLHDSIRPQIFSHASFSAKPELWVLQSILLVECFGKSRAGQKQHDMSHLFHGLLINLIRRSDCQSVSYDVHMSTGDLENDWLAWSDQEQKKRLAYLCFMWDVQHAVLFSQSLCMSAFELRSVVPCDDDLWEAGTAQDWQALMSKKKPMPPFLSTLKTLTTLPTTSLPKHLNALTRVLLLHGLMSIFWDLNRRNQTALGLTADDSRLGDWKSIIARSYDLWKADFDAFCMNQSVSSKPSRRREVSIFRTAYNAIYHAAHIILDAEILDLQIYAGARHILGRPVGRNDYQKAKRVVHDWAKTDVIAASRAAWHAAHILRDSVIDLEDFMDVDLFHYPWCLYLANVTCWAFYHARPCSTPGVLDNNSLSANNNHDDDDEMIWDARAELNGLISSMTSSRPEDLADLTRRHRTDGLTAVIAQALVRVRWGIIHDAVSVLRGLVPWRLINQYEASR